jgi:hypothetical protein
MSFTLLFSLRFLLFGVVATASAVEMRHWRRTLVAFHLYLPRNLSVDAAAHWLATVAATTHPRQRHAQTERNVFVVMWSTQAYVTLTVTLG